MSNTSIKHRHELYPTIVPVSATTTRKTTTGQRKPPQSLAINTMCDPKNTRCFELHERCGHWLPKDACDYFSYAHQKCYAAADVAKSMITKDGDALDISDELCRFCEEGKDIEGAWKYGKKWKDSANFK